MWTSAFQCRLLTVLSRASGVLGSEAPRCARGTSATYARYSTDSWPVMMSVVLADSRRAQSSSDACGSDRERDQAVVTGRDSRTSDPAASFVARVNEALVRADCLPDCLALRMATRSCLQAAEEASEMLAHSDIADNCQERGSSPATGHSGQRRQQALASNCRRAWRVRWAPPLPPRNSCAPRRPTSRGGRLRDP